MGSLFCATRTVNCWTASSGPNLKYLIVAPCVFVTRDLADRKPRYLGEREMLSQIYNRTVRFRTGLGTLLWMLVRLMGLQPAVRWRKRFKIWASHCPLSRRQEFTRVQIIQSLIGSVSCAKTDSSWDIYFWAKSCRTPHARSVSRWFGNYEKWHLQVIAVSFSRS